MYTTKGTNFPILRQSVEVTNDDIAYDMTHYFDNCLDSVMSLKSLFHVLLYCVYDYDNVRA